MARKAEVNKSGIKPLEFRALIKPTPVEERTKGGIIIPNQFKDREKYQVDTGVIIATGALCFTNPDWTDKPKVGDRVMFNRYAGDLIKGQDGEDYRLLNDREIAAVVGG